MQNTCASTQPISVLHLRGQEQDDPDLHPIRLASEPLDLIKVESKESPAWKQEMSD